MKKLYVIPALALIALLAISATKNTTSYTDNFISGDPGVQSINALTFGPEGILFIGDSKSATVFAVDTKDAQNNASASAVRMRNFDAKLAEKLGTEASNIRITDMAVNPLSKNIYLSVHNADGTPLLFRLKGDQLEAVSLKDVSYSKAEIENAVDANKKDRRGRSQRVWAIADMGFHNGKLMVSGLSNKEFSSTFRSIPFPFNKNQDHASLEIYHAAHAQFETFAPIKTFTVANIKGKEQLVASYTCTPLVLFPMDQLKNGKHVKGRTVAELGAGNSPLDIISMEKDGKSFFVMSNTNRAVMKVRYTDVEKFEGTLTEPVRELGKTEGVPYVSLPMVNVLQLDKLDDTQFVYIQRTSSGEMILNTANNRWL
ncbi:hypothetical protein GWK08_09670 [Leptobacterium flavescens]|uniref:Uncharacterized protein n=1 Tax=Leptobacterium flavescens TaxID=472055 RepID=A0A6P0UTG0_9FLAO|nr:hypothetical protein [Leptobacterium flavescens]NER13706.1 hypothetical protein [Leptobacterium flavescens]